MILPFIKVLQRLKSLWWVLSLAQFLNVQKLKTNLSTYYLGLSCFKYLFSSLGKKNIYITNFVFLVFLLSLSSVSDKFRWKLVNTRYGVTSEWCKDNKNWWSSQFLVTYSQSSASSWLHCIKNVLNCDKKLKCENRSN